MGVELPINMIDRRRELQERAECNEITPAQYWGLLRTSFENLDDREKSEEAASLN